MTWVLRHLLAIVVLPFSVTVLIPIWIARQNGTTFFIAQTPEQFAFRSVSVPIFSAGFEIGRAHV